MGDGALIYGQPGCFEAPSDGESISISGSVCAARRWCVEMRPRAIQSVPGLDPNGSPFERLEQFARIIVKVPKAEADKNIEEPRRVRPGVASKK